MSEDDGAVLRDAVIREGVALAVMAAVLWYFGPGRTWLAGIRHRAGQMMSARGSRIDAEVARFAAEVSRWDHEQAT